jgi:NadR type nicotinamide-nucleotide adenylyltransferase
MENLKRIVMIGPESTGKTTLAQELASHFRTAWTPEYAREYVENLNRPYNYEDLVHIAKRQLIIENDFLPLARKYLFVDTDLIITKVWFDVVYNKRPDWINEAIFKHKPDLYLLCSPDIEWVFDPVRENQGEMRIKLFEIYKTELIRFEMPFEVITGRDKKRIQNALDVLNQKFGNADLT